MLAEDLSRLGFDSCVWLSAIYSLKAVLVGLSLANARPIHIANLYRATPRDLRQVAVAVPLDAVICGGSQARLMRRLWCFRSERNDSDHGAIVWVS